MNLCFVMGKIVDEVKFNFVLNGKHDSIVEFSIELQNDSIINIVALDDTADYCYQKLEQNDTVFIMGKLDTKMNLKADYVKKLY